MIIISVIAGLILFFSFLGGFFQGAVKSFFSLLVLVISIPIAGRFYPGLAGLLDFLPGRDWENFLAFFIILVLAGILLNFVFFLPRKIMEKAWEQGPFFRLIGGLLNLLGAAIGLIIFANLISAYPVWHWLAQAFEDSPVISWLVSSLDFVQGLLPETLRSNGLPVV